MCFGSGIPRGRSSEKHYPHRGIALLYVAFTVLHPPRRIFLYFAMFQEVQAMMAINDKNMCLSHTLDHSPYGGLHITPCRRGALLSHVEYSFLSHEVPTYVCMSECVGRGCVTSKSLFRANCKDRPAGTDTYICIQSCIIELQLQ